MKQLCRFNRECLADVVRDEDPVLAKKTGSGALYLKQMEIFKSLKANILDNFKSLLFCFHTFGVRRTIDVVDSENQPGPGSVQIRPGSVSRALGLTAAG